MAEETIKVYGVGRGGKDVTVEGAFTIHVPYGYCYEWLPEEKCRIWGRYLSAKSVR